MRSLAAPLALAVLATLLACDDSAGPGPGPGPGPDPELPRGDVQLLVEHYARSLERSFYTMELDGSLVSPFTGIPDDATLVAPSPDGRTIAYLRLTQDTDVHIWMMDRDGGNRRPFLEGTRVVSHVAWSPDGSRLAYQNSTLDDTDDIWVVDADGSDAVNLTPDAGSAVVFDRYPAWSSDATRIAFLSNRSGTMRLWMMDADGSDAVQLVPSAIEATESFPAWSPDGAWIAFVSASFADGWAIGVVRPNGEGYRTWPVEGEDVGRVAWTLDGHILYSADVGGDYDIFALDPATGATENLTEHPGHDFRAWPLRWATPSAWLGLGAPTRYATGIADSPAIAAGDVTADGRPDLLVAGPASEELRLLRGEPNGAFTPIGSLTAPDDQREVVAADLSRDREGDVALLGEDALLFWRGSAAGPGVPTTHPFGGDGRALVAHDFDLDGNADVAAIHETPGSGFRMLVHGWQPDEERLIAILDFGTTYTGAGRACAGDVTGDGAPDVVVVTSVAASPLVLIPGHGDISFGDATVAAMGILPDEAAIPICADFDGDRRVDLALVQPGRAAGLTIFRSSGTSLVATGVLGARLSAGAAADIDRDGDVDLLVASADRPAVLFLRNRGDGRFGLPMELAMGSVPSRLAIADLDGDLWPDVAAVDAAGSVAVMRNRGR